MGWLLSFSGNDKMLPRHLLALQGFVDRRTPGYLVFFVTPYCNCGCKMCFNASVIQQAKSRDTLRLDEIERIARNFPGLHHVNFSGGEPFLRDDFERIAPLFYRYSGTRFFTVTTNSSMPDVIEDKLRAICRHCPDAWIRINQSLDAVGTLHDSIRAKQGLFHSVVELNQRLRTLTRANPNLTVGIVSVVSSFNQGHEYALLDYVYQNLFFKDYAALFVRGDTREPAAREVEAARYAQFQRAVQHRSRGRLAHRDLSDRVYAAVHQAASRLIIKVITEGRFVTPCHAGRRMLIIDDQGSVEPCEILRTLIDEKKSALTSSDLGNLRDFDYDIRKILATDHTKSVLRHIVEKKCYCTYECAMAANVLYTPRLWPLVLRSFATL
jgi:MoaA/NifB/PqqE/SkfB family radical SAM enzyme